MLSSCFFNITKDCRAYKISSNHHGGLKVKANFNEWQKGPIWHTIIACLKFDQLNKNIHHYNFDKPLSKSLKHLPPNLLAPFFNLNTFGLFIQTRKKGLVRAGSLNQGSVKSFCGSRWSWKLNIETVCLCNQFNWVFKKSIDTPLEH